MSALRSLGELYNFRKGGWKSIGEFIYVLIPESDCQKNVNKWKVLWYQTETTGISFQDVLESLEGPFRDYRKMN